MTIKEQKELVEKLTKKMYEVMNISNQTWDNEKDEATNQWIITNNLVNQFKMAIKHLNDITPPWED